MSFENWILGREPFSSHQRKIRFSLTNLRLWSPIPWNCLGNVDDHISVTHWDSGEGIYHTILRLDLVGRVGTKCRIILEKSYILPGRMCHHNRKRDLEIPELYSAYPLIVFSFLLQVEVFCFLFKVESKKLSLSFCWRRRCRTFGKRSNRLISSSGPYLLLYSWHITSITWYCFERTQNR